MKRGFKRQSRKNPEVEKPPLEEEREQPIREPEEPETGMWVDPNTDGAPPNASRSEKSSH